MAESVPSKKMRQQELAESICQEYPRKVAKIDALKAIIKAMKENDPAFLLERTKAYAAAIVWKEKQFIPHPATWFNKGFFNDDPEEWKQPVTNGSVPQSAIAHRQHKADSEYVETKPHLPLPRL